MHDLTDGAALDPWQLLGLPGALPLANYLTAPGAAQYRLIVDVLLDEQSHNLNGIAHDDLADLLLARLTPLSDTPVQLLEAMNLKARMAQLAQWDVIDAWDERPTRDEDFLRNSNRYQLTLLAAHLHRAVRRLGQDSTTSVAATFAPPILRTQLETMAGALGSDPRAVSEAWAVTQSTLDTMADAAAGWQARLAGALAGAPDAVKIATVQETLSRYVEMWGAGVDTHSEGIAAAATTLLAAPPSVWRTVALAADPAAAEDRVAELAAQYTQTLQRVRAWFGGPNSQARQLRRQMRDAIAPMVRGQRTLAAVGGHVSRRAELLALAGALEASADDSAAWALWCTATGLYSARHLGTASPQPGGQPGTTSFWDAPPAPVEARLRRHGARALTGRPARIADRAEGRAAARALAERQRQAAADTRARVVARSGLMLSAWTGVTDAELDVLLGFLAALAGARPDSTGRRTARTGDGLWHLTAEPVGPEPADAVVHTRRGRLVHPDLRLHIASSLLSLPAGAG